MKVAAGNPKAEVRISILSMGPLKHILSPRLEECIREEEGFTILEGDGSCSYAEDILSHDTVDIVLARVDGRKTLQGLGRIISNGRAGKVLITGDCDRDTILEYIRVGIRGYLARDITPTLLKKALRVVHKGEVWFDRHTSSRIAETFSGSILEDTCEDIISHLTRREREILQLLVRGYRNQDIASYLHISPRTVKVHLYNIYGKLGVEDRLSAALLMKQSMDAK
jgi:DNA-binding NarL/FixJ family response regulator